MHIKAFCYALLGFSLLLITLAIAGTGIEWRGPVQFMLLLLIVGGIVHLSLSLLEPTPAQSAETRLPTEFDQGWA